MEKVPNSTCYVSDEWQAPVALPTFTITHDGFVSVDWPKEAPPFRLATRDLIVQWVSDVNTMHAHGLR